MRSQLVGPCESMSQSFYLDWVDQLWLLACQYFDSTGRWGRWQVVRSCGASQGGCIVSHSCLLLSAWPLGLLWPAWPPSLSLGCQAPSLFLGEHKLELPVLGCKCMAMMSEPFELYGFDDFEKHTCALFCFHRKSYRKEQTDIMLFQSFLGQRICYMFKDAADKMLSITLKHCSKDGPTPISCYTVSHDIEYFFTTFWKLFCFVS